MSSADIWSNFRDTPGLDHATAWRSACLEVLRLSGLFLAETYLSRRGNPPEEVDPLAEYHDGGWREGHWPNPYFDPLWYAAQNPDVAQGGGDPLLHYVSYGEREGRRPIAWFDPGWYRVRFAVPDDTHCLAHFLRHRREGCVSPIPEFDAPWYFSRYPDVAAARMDPMEHYLVQGFRERRDPSPEFDTRFYRQRYLRGQPGENPLLHYLRHRGEPGVYPRLPPGETTIPREHARFAAPGPGFEPVQPCAPDAPRRPLVLAFYLPQFHPIAQNDAWWGDGFTEWTNLARALPRFAGHYQPRVPRDLGHYRLDDPAILKRQVALARGAGLGGFVFYFYWFDGKRLLERPLENYLADPQLDFPFCLMWANENWTRRWDGADSDVLIAQSYAEADEAALIACFARHFADPRYIRLQGRPLLMIYRPGLIPRTAATVQRWRDRFARAHGEHPLIIMAQTFGDEDPRQFGLDAAVEFPPHKLVRNLTQIADTLDLLDTEFSAQVYHFDDVVAASCAAPMPEFPLIRTAMPGWDNDARRQGQGMVIHGATPARYAAWLDHLLAAAAQDPVFGTALVCINAWNEWAEGAYLEPDQHWGAAFLNATARAIAGTSAAERNDAVLLIGHDAFPAGSQLLLLHLARRLRAAHGVTLEILLGGGGALEPVYREVATVTIVADPASLDAQIQRVWRAGYRHALVNSAASAWCCRPLARRAITTTLLVHEMPALLRARGLLGPLEDAARSAASIVFAAEAVRAAVAGVIDVPVERAVILPQGIYQPLPADQAAARAHRTAWGVADSDTLVVGMGYGDRRKGFDLFVHIWSLVARASPTVHMVWVGAIDPDLRATLAADIAAAERSGRFRLTGWRDDPADVLAAADALLLCSREDPYPSVALEALRIGTRVLAFAGAGGIPGLLSNGAGTVVPMEDCAALAAAVIALPPTRVRATLLQGHDFGDYTRALLRLIWPDRPPLSVIVPCFRQAGLLPRRLGSIFDQAVPLHDLVLRDDASDDGSPAAARRFAHGVGRCIDVVVADSNSGSPFGCWRDAVRSAHGDLIWIAEADDASEPGFLARVLPAFAAPDVILAFADSRPIGRAGEPRSERYRDSYEAVGGAGSWARDEVWNATDFARTYLAERNILFNVSALVWRRAPLLAALERLGPDLLSWRVAGDWRLHWEALHGQAGRVAYVAQALNLHCRDPASASARVSPTRHVEEIRRMHALIRAGLGDPPGLAARQARYRRQASAHLRDAPETPASGGRNKPRPATAL